MDGAILICFLLCIVTGTSQQRACDDVAFGHYRVLQRQRDQHLLRKSEFDHRRLLVKRYSEFEKTSSAHSQQSNANWKRHQSTEEVSETDSTRTKGHRSKPRGPDSKDIRDADRLYRNQEGYVAASTFTYRGSCKHKSKPEYLI